MFKFILLLITLLISSSSCELVTPAEYLLKTNSLPADLNFMPSLSNGHLGYTVFGDAIFMNGVYNGAAGNSQRARIPNWLNIKAELCDRFGCAESEANVSRSYEMNLLGGYFSYKQHYPGLDLTLEQRSYAHRFYNRAVIYELLAKRHATAARTNSPQFIKLSSQPGNASSAIDFELINKGSSAAGDFRHLRGHTKVLEQQPFQTSAHELHLLFSEPLEQPLQLPWPTWQAELQHRIILSIDKQESVARKELQQLLQLEPAQLLSSHTQAWLQFWQQQFSIELLGDGALELSRIVNAGIFYLASSLPSLSSHQPNEFYYGLSPTGLARGNLEADYQGHNFWDTEIWMLPAVTQFDFEYAKQLLEYRFRHLEGARYNANLTGYKGARFPWESAYTGTEVTNPCCPVIAQQEIHVSPDISFALKKLFAQSKDWSWLCERAWPIAAEVADFLASRASCDESGSCHLLHVMGPDEDHENVDDNAYTNAVAKIALDFAVWTGEQCAQLGNRRRFESWRNLSQALLVLHDQQLNYHPQHLGYRRGDIVKQADTILLGYPLLYDTSATHRNDLDYYANVTRESGPAMTWSMFAINYLDTFDPRADDYFKRGYESYVRPEFKVWSETPRGYAGSANFLTGIGGFLQALLNGYGGLDFIIDDNQPTMLLRNTNVPPLIDQVTVKYINLGKLKCSWFL
ncbi:LOW QUALITY PROTEIN: protein-glucosylgalactosylhydroxylysine glucosidase [Drosophila busckii]|uniref:LOW QUALITY PROTEIN: protein-glucosylgalactosylhydroxylysine glucosidase n=1 Tax=Drosophila busckii TaxID=30019 RepID=UPI001432FBDD|nr:LOW QUALITY PROTEIN: protein-glucosylgalactosylhydroxylysine glucosidase [Drosophila busckii]